ncbi:MAG: aldo/keto reductase [Litorivicinus sp.]
MKMNPLTADITVSLLGLGSVKFGRNQGVKYPSAFELPSDAQCRDLLSIARDAGVNLVDTAPAYGRAEERLGTLLRGQRSEWVLGTKVGETFDGASHFDFTAGGADASLARSLRRLQTDYLDYVLLHSDGQDDDVLNSGACEALIRARDAGWVRAIGISSKTRAGGQAAMELGLDIVMMTLNSEDQSEAPLCELAHQLDRGILVKKAMGSGHLDPQDSLTLVARTPGVSSIISGTLNPKHFEPLRS